MAGETRRGRLVARAGGVLFLLWGVGQLARDIVLPTAWLFYLPNLGVAALLLAAAAWVRWRGGRAWPLAAAALAPLAVGLLVEHRWTAGSPPEPPQSTRGRAEAAVDRPLRLLHWNVTGGWTAIDQQAVRVATAAPDLVVLSEAPDRVARRIARQLPGFSVRTWGSISVLGRDLGEGEFLERRRELQVVEVPLRHAGRPLRLLAVNVISAPRVHRDPWLRRALGLIAERQPDLVAGDFNAPRRSWALASPPAGFRHAYDEAGSGWSASWPVPLPWLSLDHVLVGPRLRATAYRLESTPWSDHRLQLVELAAR